MPSAKPAEKGSGTPPVDQSSAPESSQSAKLILEKFESSSCLITVSRSNTVIGRDRENKFFELIDQLQDIDSDKSRLVIWVLDMGSKNDNPKIQSLNEYKASQNFRAFKDILSDPRGSSCRGWLGTRSVFFLANPSDDLTKNNDRFSSFDRGVYRRTKFNSSKFFRSIVGKVEARASTKAATIFLSDSEDGSAKNGASNCLKVEYYGHKLNQENLPVQVKRNFSSTARNQMIQRFYLAGKAHIDGVESCESEKSFLELVKAGFLVCNFEEFISIK